MSEFIYDDNFKAEISKNFESCTDLSDFAKLLNQIKSKGTGNKFIEEYENFSIKNLRYILVSKDSRYSEIQLPKKNGSKRKIHAPDKYLKLVQKVCLELLYILTLHKIRKSCHGFISGKSILTNARSHINKNIVCNFDISNFFPSISFRRVKSTLSGNSLGINSKQEEFLFFIANISTYKGFLPQGSPLSPYIANLVTISLDSKFENFARNKNYKYTRYADDITISTNDKIEIKKIGKTVERILKSEGFTLNKEKSRLHKKNQRQSVTGVIVNQKMNVTRNYIRKVRSILFNWEVKGIEEADVVFNKNYKKNHNGNVENVVKGYINFIGQVRGLDDRIYKKLNHKYELLVNSISYSTVLHKAVRKQLQRDNLRMEEVLFSDRLSEEEKFIAFVTNGFYQIENLINYYFYLKFETLEVTIQGVKPY
jgi:retron-type reverse transcriptase